MKEQTIAIRSEWIKLDSLLKFSGAVSTGGEAKTVIAAEQVQVNGQVCTMRGKKIRPGDRVILGDATVCVAAE